MSNNDSSVSQTLALAGVLQAAYLVDQIARTGSCAAESFNPSIQSLFKFDVDSTQAVYGGIHGVDLGLRVLQDVLNGSNAAQYRTVIRYALGLLYLQKKLSVDNEVMQVIHNRLQHAALKFEHFTDNPEAIAANIASIYQDTVSTMKFRIQVTGSMQQLQNPANADKIRALLMAGIRSAVLWRQTGGKRWHLFLSRQRLQKTARQLVAS